ncbi:MAG: ATP-binding cassette domain-containing protein [Trueperella sp.]|nr:ATP-binding cassette domain-containing protein [Trueperella sp.]
MPEPVVEITDLHVQLGSAHILRGVDLELTPGRTLAVLGANGSGKSTLIRTLMGITPVQRGSIELFGTPLSRRRQVPWEKIGYAPQRVTATSGVPATALETVAAGLVYGSKLRPGRGWREKAMAALDLVGLAHRANESVQTFSGGQQQRVTTARALVRKPELLILDEPFAGIDAASRAALIETLEAQHRAGVALILVLHELYEIEYLIDEAVVLEQGKIVQHSECDHGLLVGQDNHHAHGTEHPHYRSPVMAGTL